MSRRMSSISIFEIPLFNANICFMLWQSIIQDLLIQQGLDETLENVKLKRMIDSKVRFRKRVISTIRLSVAPKTKYNVLTESMKKRKPKWLIMLNGGWIRLFKILNQIKSFKQIYKQSQSRSITQAISTK